MAEMEAPSRYYFVGTVQPERVSFALNPDRGVEFEGRWESGSYVGKMWLTLSQVCVRLDVPGAEQPDVLTLKQIATSIVESHADAAGFVLGATFSIDLSSTITPDGEFTVWHTGFDGVGDDDPQADWMVQLAHAALAEPRVLTAIGDVRRAIEHAHETALFCFRAVESIRQIHVRGADNGAARRASWESLKDATGVPQDDLDWLTEASIPRRHGEIVLASATDRLRALKVARAVIEAHVRGSSPGAATEGALPASADQDD